MVCLPKAFLLDQLTVVLTCSDGIYIGWVLPDRVLIL